MKNYKTKVIAIVDAYVNAGLNTEQIAEAFEQSDISTIHQAFHVAIERVYIDDALAESLYNKIWSYSKDKRKVADAYTKSFEIREKNIKDLQEKMKQVKSLQNKILFYKSFLKNMKPEAKKETEKLINSLKQELKSYQKKVS